MAEVLSPVGVLPGKISYTKTAMAMAVEQGATMREVRELARLRSRYSAEAAAAEADSRSGPVHAIIEERVRAESRAILTAGEVRRMIDGLEDDALLAAEMDPDRGLVIYAV